MGAENIGITKSTSEKCPVSGYWQAVYPRGASFFIKKGQPMPRYESKEVDWVLIDEDEMDE